MNPKKKQKFLRQEWFRKVSLGKKWRAPKGKQSKLRKHIKGKGFIPTVGYGSPKSMRGKHPCGLVEVVVRNTSELDRIEPGKECIKIASTVGRKKRGDIIKKAQEKKIKILNPKKAEKKKAKKKEVKKEEKKEEKPKEEKKEEKPKEKPEEKKEK